MTVGTFTLVSIIVPLLFIGITGFIRKSIARKYKASFFYLGVDIALGALAASAINGIDPQERLINKSLSAYNPTVRFIFGHGVISAVIFDFVMLIFLMSLHQDYEMRREAVPKPSKKEKVTEAIVMGIIYNGLGVITMIVSEVILRY